MGNRYAPILAWARKAFRHLIVPVAVILFASPIANLLFRERPARLQIIELAAVDTLGSSSFWQAAALPIRVEWDETFGLERERWIQLKHLHLVLIQFRNTGNKPFVFDESIKSPISLRVVGEGRILIAERSPQQTSRTDQRLRLRYSGDRRSVDISSDFLNAGDSLGLFVMHNAAKSDSLAVDSRIAGHPALSIERESSAPSSDVARRITSYLIIAFSIVTTVAIAWKARTNSRRTAAWFLILSIVLGSVLAWAYWSNVPRGTSMGITFTVDVIPWVALVFLGSQLLRVRILKRKPVLCTDAEEDSKSV